MFKKFLISVFLIIGYFSVWANEPINKTSKETGKDPYVLLVEQLTSYAKKFRGVPYVWGGTRPTGFDCSGFVRYVFAKFDMSISHSSKELAEIGYVVEPEQAFAGDLIFFRSSRNPASQISHVGIVISNDGKSGVRFMHAASSKGVTQSSLSEKYYTEHFVCIKRVVDVLNNYSYD